MRSTSRVPRGSPSSDDSRRGCQRPMKTTPAVLILTVFAECASAQAPATGTAAGCPIEPVKFHACAQPKMKTFSPPRTADGHPDLNGYWERAFTSQDIEEHGDGLGVQA